MKSKILLNGIALASALCIAVVAQAKTEAVGWDALPQILAKIKAPEFPDRSFDITDYGAKEGGKALCTKAFKKAIDACVKAGGGKVVVPAGRFLTGPIHLQSNVNLVVGKGATLVFSDNFKHYLPPVFVRWEGEECYNLSPLIYANGCENIGITGEGTLDGQGPTWWKWREESATDLYREANNRKMAWARDGVPVADRVQGKGDDHWCPTFISPINCKNVLIEGLTLINGPFWNVHPVYCENVTVRGLEIVNDGPNGDGCNPSSSSYVLIEDCVFKTGDDCIAIKSGKNADGRRVGKASEYIIVRDCVMNDGHGGVVIGSEMSGGVRNVYAEDCVMDSPHLKRALRIKTNSVRGGTVENVYMRNVKIGQVDEAVLKVNFYYGEKDTGQHTPTVRNVNMENVTCNKSEYGLLINGYPRSPITDINLKNCSFENVEKENFLEGVKDIDLQNVSINGKRLKRNPLR